MRIRVSQVSEEEGQRIDLLFPEGEPVLRSKDCRVTGQPSLKGKVTREGSEVRIRGRLKASVLVPCARCLAPTRVDVDEDLDLLYVPLTDQRAMSEEHELADTELQIAFYQGDEIDLEDVIRERVELAIPMALVCGEDCQGLCPNCGANLNEGECACSTETIDPRWAALRDFKS